MAGNMLVGNYIYGNAQQWNELHSWFCQWYPAFVIYLRKCPNEETHEFAPICYIPNIKDWLQDHCPLQWLLDELQSNVHVIEIINENI